MPVEAIIVAVIGLLASIGAALIAGREQARTTSVTLYTELCRGQQLRIDQLGRRLSENEAEIETLRLRIKMLEDENAAMRAENQALQLRVQELERENESLMRLIAALQDKRRKS